MMPFRRRRLDPATAAMLAAVASESCSYTDPRAAYPTALAYRAGRTSDVKGATTMTHPDPAVQAIRDALATSTTDAAERHAHQNAVYRRAAVTFDTDTGGGVSRCWDGAPETAADKRFFDLRESGYTGPIDQDGHAVTDPDTLAIFAALDQATQRQMAARDDAGTSDEF